MHGIFQGIGLFILLEVYIYFLTFSLHFISWQSIVVHTCTCTSMRINNIITLTLNKKQTQDVNDMSA